MQLCLSANERMEDALLGCSHCVITASDEEEQFSAVVQLSLQAHRCDFHPLEEEELLEQDTNVVCRCTTRRSQHGARLGSATRCGETTQYPRVIDLAEMAATTGVELMQS